MSIISGTTNSMERTMPFDGNEKTGYGDADFDVAYLPTRMPNKVYVVRTDTDEAILLTSYIS
jgi:hypothetical protein